MANYVLSEELRRAVVQVVNQHQSSFQPRPKRGRRVRGGGGGDAGSVNSLSSFGVVVEQAEAATVRYNQDHTQQIGLLAGVRGSAKLLDSESMTVWPDGDPNANPIQFASVHAVPCKVGTIVRLTAKNAIVPGSLWTDNQVWGQLIWSIDELYALPGATAAKVLWLPETATKSTDMRWDGTECP